MDMTTEQRGLIVAASVEYDSFSNNFHKSPNTLYLGIEEMRIAKTFTNFIVSKSKGMEPRLRGMKVIGVDIKSYVSASWDRKNE